MALRALIQDDQATLRFAAAHILKAEGFEVEYSEDGRQGLEKMKEGKFDIIFTDVEMPNMNGFEFLARVKKDPALMNIPVVMCTTLNNPEHIDKGRKLGAVSYIVKPMQKETLQRALKNAGLLK